MTARRRQKSKAEGMMDERKELSVGADGATRRHMIIGAGAAMTGIAVGSVNAWAAGGDGVAPAEAIHQEEVFKASRKRVYEALTDARQFDKVVKLSAAMQSMKSLGDKPTEISREAGGAFSLFGGYVTGRQIELVPDERIVQAWRSGSWGAGVYSIARFELKDEGSGTKIIFDHRGFPDGTTKHLVTGWYGNYWEPLAKALAE
jgi:activator of HSP90 ATPase